MSMCECTSGADGVTAEGTMNDFPENSLSEISMGAFHGVSVVFQEISGGSMGFLGRSGGLQCG